MPFTPYIKSPLTDLAGNIANNQSGGRCMDFEYKVTNCLEAYGMARGVEKCGDLLQDLKECMTLEKQSKRVFEMRRERLQQIKSGKLSKGEEFASIPAVDAHQ